MLFLSIHETNHPQFIFRYSSFFSARHLCRLVHPSLPDRLSINFQSAFQSTKLGLIALPQIIRHAESFFGHNTATSDCQLLEVIPAAKLGAEVGASAKAGVGAVATAKFFELVEFGCERHEWTVGPPKTNLIDCTLSSLNLE